MPSTTKCTQVGQDITSKRTPFQGAEVFISNPAKVLDNQTWKALEVFWTKKDAQEFCKNHGYTQNNITPVHSRWQKGYAIGLGRGYYVPVCAVSRIIAHAMGCIVDSVEL